MRYLLLFLVLPFSLSAQPSTEVYVFNLLEDTNGYKLSNPLNVSNQNPGYDNQPHFTHDCNLLFTRTINDQTEGVMYNFKSGTLKNMTNSPANEYSPTPMPDGEGLSCIYDSVQHLVSYNFKTGNREVIIDNLVVGYHCWLDAENLILFVLGDVMTLQHYNLTTRKNIVLDKNIDRSLLKIPNSRSFSYIDRKTTPKSIVKIDLGLQSRKIIAEMPNESQDIAWLPNGTIITGNQSELLMAKPGSKWKVLADLAEFGLTGITRIAVSPGGDKIALVVNE